MKYFLSGVLFFLMLTLQAQLPKDYFSKPLKIPTILSGTFGELRSNHFHSGLDIKTQGRTGLKVHAAAEGYVSRIKISHYGYGKALYVKHPNGYTTVYAHLEKFSPKIEAYVKKRQYENESFTIELFPNASEIALTKEEHIAFSGNTGGSGGPHLHFEIRDGSSRPMNPMLFGFDIADTRKPLVNTVWLYPLNDNAQINGQNKPYRLKTTEIKGGNLKADTVIALGAIGVGVSTVDQQDGAYNKNGIYRINSKVNGTTNFELKMKRFSFSETRYLNRMIDYAYFKENRSRITKLFIEENNPLSIYNKSLTDGVIKVQDALSYNVEVSVEDAKGNARVINIPIEGQKLPYKNPVQHDSSPFVAFPTEPFYYNSIYASVKIPKNAVYDEVPLHIEELPNDRLEIHNNLTPLHKHMEVTFSLNDHGLTKQAYIGTFKEEDKPKYVGAKVKDNKITARTREFGKFGVFKDTEAPIVNPVNFLDKKWISNNKTLKITIKDLTTGIKKYKATINDKFALMEYDYKKNSLTYNFEDGISKPGENKLKLYVEDNVGNSTIFEASFFRKQ